MCVTVLDKIALFVIGEGLWGNLGELRVNQNQSNVLFTEISKDSFCSFPIKVYLEGFLLVTFKSRVKETPTKNKTKQICIFFIYIYIYIYIYSI